MDGGREFQLSYDASRDDFERGVLARLDASGTARSSRLSGVVLIVVALVVLLVNVLVVLPSGEDAPWWSWVLAVLVLGFGVAQVTLWDRRTTIRRFYRANESLMAVHVDEVIDDDSVRSTSSGSEARLDWSQFSAVLECDDLLVLALGDLRRGGAWTTPKRGLADPTEWPELVALAREKVSGPYFRSRR